MVTNVFFNNFKQFGEQKLYEDLIVEAIRIHGQDMYYIPRKAINTDPIYGASDQVYYDDAYLIELYIKSVDGFEGDGSFMSKFSVEIRDQVTFTIAKRVFDDEIGRDNSFPRPREGDLIYFPLNKKCFEIKYVDNKPFFYPLGELFTYDLYCELYEYSNENFNTGITDIDVIQQKFSTNIYDSAILDSSGAAILDSSGYAILPGTYDETNIDPFDDSEVIQTGTGSVGQEGSDDIIDWTEKNPFSENGIY